MKLRNLFSTVLVSSSLVLPLAATAHADAGVNLTDIDGPNVYANHEIQFLSQQGIINGYEDGTFRPGNAMDREEFAAILTRALGLSQDASASAQFSDVPDWAKGYVGALMNAGITNGVSSSQFDGAAPVSRQDLAVFMMRAMGYENLAKNVNVASDFTDFGQVWDYAKPDVALSQKIGFIRGQQDDSGALVFTPSQSAERQAVARLVYELYTNGAQYKTQLGAIQQTDDALAKSSAVMDQLSSVEMSVYQQGPKDVEIDTTVGSNAYGTPTTFEFYHQNGIDYTLDPKTNQWKKKTVGDPSSDSTTNAHFASPYLTLTDNTDSYVLTGTFDQKALTQQLSNSSLLYIPGLDITKINTIQYKINIDKTTLYQTTVNYVVTYATGDTAAGKITYQKFNQVDPIQIPQEALNPQ